MNPILLRYVGLALVASIFGVGGGYLAVNKNASPVPPSGTVVAVPAQPFPGQGIPAIPATPARPQKGKPDIKASTISYIQGEAGKNQVVNPMLVEYGGYTRNDIFGTDFSPKNNTIYWDGAVLVRDIDALEASDGTQQMYLPVPANTELGSFHTVYIKSPYGTSNTIKVQAVEHHETPWFLGIRPYSGPVGTKAEARIWESMQWSFWPDAPSKPLSAKIYLGFMIPANQIKSGAEGFVHVFVPSELERSSTDPSHYAFTMPSEVVYCPPWAWDSSMCTMAPANTMVPLKGTNNPITGSMGGDIFFVYEYKYRGVVKGLGNSGAIDTWTTPESPPWSFNFTITP